MKVFAAIGRFSVRHRWSIILAWIVGAFVVVSLLPSLSSVEKSSGSNFLPSDAPSVVAGKLNATFGSTTVTTLVAATRSGALTPADNAVIDRVELAMKSIPHVSAVVDQGSSSNHRARRALVEIDLPQSAASRRLVAVVDGLRSTFFASGASAGLVFHLTGGVAASVDSQNQSTHTAVLTELLSVLFIISLLFLTFRALLAPFVALLPSVVAMVVAGPLIALSTRVGVQVSDLTPILLTVVLLGAGTDYGLFLIFRLREEIRRGRSVHDAVAVSVCKVGESITFSGLTVMGALATVAIATFGLYRGLGPALAIGIAIALIANLTLLPALLTVLGTSVFWPRVPASGQRGRGTWGAIAGKVVGRPVLTLILGLVFLGGLAASMVAYTPSGFGSQGPPASSDSGRGQAILMKDFPTAGADSAVVLFRLPISVWNEPRVLAGAARGLRRTAGLASVTGALNPDGSSVGAGTLTAAHQQLARYGPAARLGDLPPPGSAVPPATWNAYRDSTQYISADGRTIRYDVSLTAGPASSTAAARSIPRIRTSISRIARQIGATSNGIHGNASSAADIGSISGQDLATIIPIVFIVLAVLLAIVLRSLIAPWYLVASVGLSYLASLGFAVLVFELVGGHGGINFVLPFFMFIFIMALGQDYNILVMTRIREEAHHAPIAVAVRRAMESTGTTVTSAGLILAGTFGVLTATGDTQVQEIGLGLAAGILLDTFFVRTLLVPSVAVLLGRWNWWPSKLSSEDAGEGGQPLLGGSDGPRPDCDRDAASPVAVEDPSERTLAGVRP
ncbi:MAG: MMPL family transporter [Acidimicrobiales bacterium]